MKVVGTYEKTEEKFSAGNNGFPELSFTFLIAQPIAREAIELSRRIKTKTIS